MAVKTGPSISCLAASLSSTYHTRRSSQLSLSRGLNETKHDSQQLRYAKVGSFKFIEGILNSRRGFSKRNTTLFATSEDQSPFSEFISVASELEDQLPSSEDISPSTDFNLSFEGSRGRPGFISFYNCPYKEGNGTTMPIQQSNQNSLLWFIGPAVLVASFIFPSLYLRRILSTIFEDSLLTDFLILFFTEALFYCGVAAFLLLIDLNRRPHETETHTAAMTFRTLTPQFGQRISSVATLVLSLIIPMVTMGLVWPWTGPATSATLAPYLVGIVVQFAFEQYARHKKSPSWPVIPIIFQVYRLHQLNRAAQLVTALSFTVRGAKMTSHNLAITNSLATLLNVLQCLGVICIWSLSNFLMRSFASNS